MYYESVKVVEYKKIHKMLIIYEYNVRKTKVINRRVY